jgi:hypothetical protein
LVPASNAEAAPNYPSLRPLTVTDLWRWLPQRHHRKVEQRMETRREAEDGFTDVAKRQQTNRATNVNRPASVDESDICPRLARTSNQLN